MSVGFLSMVKKRAGWLCVLFIAEMLTASAMQSFEDALEKAIVLALFIPLIMSSGGNSGSQATSLIIRALALQEVQVRDWWRVLLRELPSGITLGAILGLMGALRITIWQNLGLFDYGPHWKLVTLTIASASGGHRDLRLAGRLDAAIHCQEARLRSRNSLGAICCYLRRRDGHRDLLHGRNANTQGDHAIEGARRRCRVWQRRRKAMPPGRCKGVEARRFRCAAELRMAPATT